MKIPTKASKLQSYIPPWLAGRRLAPFRGNATLQALASDLGVSRPAPAVRTGVQPALVSRVGGKKARGRFEALLADFLDLFRAKKAGPRLETDSYDEADADADADATGGLLTNDAGAAAAQQAEEHGRLAAHARALKELVGGDDREECGRGFPYTAVGQIQTVDASGLYVCTGTLIAPDKVCVRGGGGGGGSGRARAAVGGRVAATCAAPRALARTPFPLRGCSAVGGVQPWVTPGAW